MTGTDAVLAAIDHALDDYDTSVDAMRWTPEVTPHRPTLFQLPVIDRAAFEAAVQTALAGPARVIAKFAGLLAVGMEPACRDLHKVISKAFGSSGREPVPVRRVDLARERHVASMMRRRDRRAARRRMAA